MTGVSDGATRLLAKLRAFVDSCDPEERALLAMLLAPGLTEVSGGEAAEGDDDVHGFAMAEWPPPSLAAALDAALERRTGTARP
jgi:hypothetical protein